MGGVFSIDTYIRAYSKLKIEPVALSDRILITGGNEGLGFETALKLSEMGAHIIIASSNYEKSLKAIKKLKKLSNNPNITCELLDLSSFRSVNEFSKKIIKKYDRLDTLICNSSVSLCNFELTEDNYERTIQVNYLGHALLVLSLLPILKNTNNSRIVFVTSKAYALYNLKLPEDFQPSSKTHHYYKSYSISKLMQLLFAKKLSKLLINYNIKVISVYPGFSKSRLGMNNFEHFTGLRKLLVHLISWLLFKVCARSTEQGAINIVFGAICKSIENGGYYNSCKLEDVKGQATDCALSDKLWEHTLSILNMDERNINI